ncbi:hypothetical protein UA08_01136 [Talaromyces atroroseus]|uniref:Alpha/beta hydrolase fold-3 domain-containing protein n=1 Tax=Talaromyces atroroseus TaxID=1441469 RepID=A0A1Q5Q9X6_TALAT|nr:hypothetical protein UA08_01136 [Talaromyces atroroseus]OKL62732.1 hypothetical protein UA08_01136 [Talaromyces atroroseus]
MYPINQGWTKPDESLEEMHISGTAVRAESDSEKLKASGLEGKFTFQDHKVTTRDGSSIPLRIYTPNTTPPFCASIATSLGVIVVHPCPRLIHEAKYPTAHNDAWDAIEWILEHAGALGGDLSNLVISGVSSGANLAASVTQQFSVSGKDANSAVRLKGQILMVPWLVQPEAFPYHLFADEKRLRLSNAQKLCAFQRREWNGSRKTSKRRILAIP